MPDISCWHQCSCRTGKCWHACCCCFFLQVLNVRTHWDCQDQEVCLLFFPPSFRWVLSDLLVASRDHQSSSLASCSGSQGSSEAAAGPWGSFPSAGGVCCSGWWEHPAQTCHGWWAEEAAPREHKDFYQQRHQRCVSGAWRGGSCWATQTRLLHRARFQLSRAGLVSAGTSHPLSEGRCPGLFPAKYRVFTFC